MAFLVGPAPSQCVQTRGGARTDREPQGSVELASGGVEFIQGLGVGALQ